MGKPLVPVQRAGHGHAKGCAAGFIEAVELRGIARESLFGLV
jgi:hypothetical protein